MSKRLLKTVFVKCIEWRLFSFVPDELYLRVLYRLRMGKKLHLDASETFNEKLQWLKLHDRDPKYTTMVDKYAAKKWVADRIGEQYIIPTLGVWDHFDDIDFDALPDQFVLKCTHDSGSIVIVKNKAQMDKKAARKKLETGLRRNWYDFYREWPYKDVPPRIIAEKYMVDESGTELKDYKFFTFDGVARVMFIATERQTQDVETKFDFYDMDFVHLPFTNGHPNASVHPAKPKSFEEMRRCAEELSQGIPYVRVDFYEVNGQAYFGELTFSHWAGMMPFDPPEWDEKFGSWLKLSGGGGIV